MTVDTALSRALMRQPKYRLVRWLLSHADLRLCSWCGQPYDDSRVACTCGARWVQTVIQQDEDEA